MLKFMRYRMLLAFLLALMLCCDLFAHNFLGDLPKRRVRYPRRTDIQQKIDESVEAKVKEPEVVVNNQPKELEPVIADEVKEPEKKPAEDMFDFYQQRPAVSIPTYVKEELAKQEEVPKEVYLNFYSIPNCAPCQKNYLELQKGALEYKIYDVNRVYTGTLPAGFVRKATFKDGKPITAYPAFEFVVDGEVKVTWQGYTSWDTIKRHIKKYE